MFKTILMMSFLFFIASVPVWSAATSDAYYQAGNKLYGQGNYDLCLRYYKAAIQADPQNWKAYQAMGSCEYHMGLKDDAIHDFNQSLAINPNNPSLQNFVNKISIELPASKTNFQKEGLAAKENDYLPKKGSISWSLAFAKDSFNYQDIVTDFSPTQLSFSAEPIGGEVDLGADYTLSSNFQLGVQGQLIFKTAEQVTILPITSTFSESCGGLAVDLKYLIPLNRDFRLILNGQAGFYSLTETTDITYGSSSGNGNYDLNGTSVGGLLGLDIEWVLDKGAWGLDLGISYRELSFNTITYTSAISINNGATPSQTLLNNSGGNFTMDFSGPRFDLGVRFF